MHVCKGRCLGFSPWFILGTPSNYDNWVLYACGVRDQRILPQGKTITTGDLHVPIERVDRLVAVNLKFFRCCESIALSMFMTYSYILQKHG